MTTKNKTLNQQLELETSIEPGDLFALKEVPAQRPLPCDDYLFSIENDVDFESFFERAENCQWQNMGFNENKRDDHICYKIHRAESLVGSTGVVLFLRELKIIDKNFGVNKEHTTYVFLFYKDKTFFMEKPNFIKLFERVDL